MPRQSKPSSRSGGVRVKRPSRETIKQQRTEEARVYGENACRALFMRRPQAIVRAYFAEDAAPRFGECMQFLAQQRRAYKVVSDEELERVAASQHHGGVVMVVKKQPPIDMKNYLRHAQDRSQDCVVVFDGVANPHNVGAVLRSCAHFGVRGLLLGDVDVLHSGAAGRVAEGGAEYIESIQCPDMLTGLQALKQAGYALLTTSSHANQSLYQFKMPAKLAIVLGEEMHGISRRVMQSSDICIAIPGTGSVESLNVSVAAGVIMAEWYRQNRA